MNSALEWERQENRETRINATMAFASILSMVDPEGNAADKSEAMRYIVDEILMEDQEMFAVLFPKGKMSSTETNAQEEE